MASAAGRSTAVALLSAVKPTFMLPAVALSVAGGALVPTFSAPTAVLRAAAVGAALYTAHVVDEYVDAHVRGEEESLLSEALAIRAATASSLAFAALVAALWLTGSGLAAAATVPLWVLAVLHAPLLDKHPVTVTVDFPVGVALAFVAGHLAQASVLPLGVLAVAVLLAVSLSARKVAIDRLDLAFDRSIDKRTLPVLLGDRAGALAGAAIHGLGAALAVGSVAAGVLPSLALAAAVVSLAEAVAAVRLSARWSVRAQMALAYPFTAELLVAECAGGACAAAALLP